MSGKKYFQKPKQAEEPTEKALPKFNAYDPKIFHQLYLPDLLADMLLIIFSFLVSNELFTDSAVFVSLKPWQITAMYSIVTLTLPWYLGYIYVRNSAFYSKRTMTIFLWIFILMTLMILVNLVRLVFVTDWEKTDNWGGPDAFTAMFAMFLLVLGPMMCMGGAASAWNSFSPDGDESQKFKPDAMMASGALLMIVLAIAYMIYFIGLFPEGSDGWVVVVAYFGGPLAAVLTFGVFLAFLYALERIGVYKYLAILARTLFPFFIISVLVFWSGVAIHFMMGDFSNQGTLSGGGMLFSVCVSGLVPFRIIMMFSAPIRLTNIIIGILSLGYFFFQMMQLVR